MPIQHIPHPRRLLILSPPATPTLPLLTILTGSAPAPRTLASGETTTAGLTHVLALRTRYYTADIPVWLDEAPDAAAWQSDFLGPDAVDVVRAVGAWVVVFGAGTRDEGKALMRSVQKVLEQVYNGGWYGVCIAVGMGMESMGEDWEEECWGLGFEYVDGDVEGGERDEMRELKGIARLREALEANEWEGEDELETGDEGDGFGLETAQMEGEFAGLKMALLEDEGEEEDEAEQVQELERMMMKMSAVKGKWMFAWIAIILIHSLDMSAHMSESDRRRLAARTVNELMNNKT